MKIDLDQIGYGNPSKRTVDRNMEFLCDSTGCEDPDLTGIPLINFPSNSSSYVFQELEYLYALQEEERPFMESLIQRADKDGASLFYDLCARYQIDSYKEEVEEIKEDVGVLIGHLKMMFNRPRPFQLAAILGVPLYPMDSISAWSAAYPSGHSLQAEILSKFYSEKYPEIADKFDEVAKMISHTRLVGGFHYPSDVEYAEVIADKIWSYR